MAKGGSTTTQQQQVSQTTNVQVTNVIEDAGLEPLQRAQILADIFAKIDQVEIDRQKAAIPDAVVVTNQSGPFDFLREPRTVALIAVAVVGVLIVARKLKK